MSRAGADGQTRAKVEALGRRFLGLKADLADPAQRVGLIDRVVAHFGRIDIPVNNAGSGTRYPPEEYPMVDWRELIEVHLMASFDLSHWAATHVLPQGKGRIINAGILRDGPGAGSEERSGARPADS